jgi:hypothetical protein
MHTKDTNFIVYSLHRTTTINNLSDAPLDNAASDNGIIWKIILKQMHRQMTRLQITLCKIILHPPERPDNIQMDDPITQEQFNDNLFNIRSMISDLRLGYRPYFRNIVRNNGLRVYLNSYDGSG